MKVNLKKILDNYKVVTHHVLEYQMKEKIINTFVISLKDI